MSLCIAGAGVAVAIAAGSFTLSWTHTIERTDWHEEWTVGDGSLLLRQASVTGSGAGMEPPEGAVLQDGAYVWTPNLPPLPELVLRRDPHAGDWRLCAAARCDALRAWLGADADPVRLYPCARAD